MSLLKSAERGQAKLVYFDNAATSQKPYRVCLVSEMKIFDVISDILGMLEEVFGY